MTKFLKFFWGVHELPPSPQKDNVCYLRIYTQIEPRRTHLNFEALKLQKNRRGGRNVENQNVEGSERQKYFLN